MYITYIIRCTDDSLYTGITNNLERRIKEHQQRGLKSAKYMRSHAFQKLECVFASNNRSQASKLEFLIKTLSKNEKEELISGSKKLEFYFEDKIDSKNYQYERY